MLTLYGGKKLHGSQPRSTQVNLGWPHQPTDIMQIAQGKVSRSADFGNIVLSNWMENRAYPLQKLDRPFTKNG